MGCEKCINLLHDYCKIAPRPPVSIIPFKRDNTPRPTWANGTVRVWNGERYRCTAHNDICRQGSCSHYQPSKNGSR